LIFKFQKLYFNTTHQTHTQYVQQAQAQRQRAEAAAREEAEQQRAVLLKQVLTAEAATRLAILALVKADKARAVGTVRPAGRQSRRSGAHSLFGAGRRAEDDNHGRSQALRRRRR